jgi:hypothetical protein
MHVAKVWNKLPDQVIHASSTNAFINRLDKYPYIEEEQTTQWPKEKVQRKRYEQVISL